MLLGNLQSLGDKRTGGKAVHGTKKVPYAQNRNGCAAGWRRRSRPDVKTVRLRTRFDRLEGRYSARLRRGLRRYALPALRAMADVRVVGLGARTVIPVGSGRCRLRGRDVLDRRRVIRRRIVVGRRGVNRGGKIVKRRPRKRRGEKAPREKP